MFVMEIRRNIAKGTWQSKSAVEFDMPQAFWFLNLAPIIINGVELWRILLFGIKSLNTVL